jgi:hypothetical protein
MRFPARVLPFALLLLAPSSDSTAVTTAVEQGQRARLAQARIPFVENCGQLDDRVAFSAHTLSGTVFVTRDGQLVYTLPRDGWSLTETFLRGRPTPAAGLPAVTAVSDFHGNDPRRWQTALPSYEEVRLGEVWPGVSVLLRAHGGNVEKIFTFQPGSRVDRVRLGLAGAHSLQIDAAGALVAETENGEVRFTPLLAYQESRGARRSVSATYVLSGSRYGFRIGPHDPSLPVVVDPLLQTTYLGGSAGEGISAIAVHPTTGEVYVAGGTTSTDFPGTAGGASSSFGGIADFFAARFDASLTTLLQATYLGGSAQQGVGALAFDALTGDVLVGGFTTQTADFPATTGGAQTSYGGGDEDGWVARLDASLTTLRQATYLGGSFQDFVSAIAVDPVTGDVFVAGESFSPDLPGTTGGAQPGSGGLNDGFVARLDPTLTTYVKTTYLGGSDAERVDALAVDPATGDLLVVGYTASADFPFTAGGAEPDSPGGAHGFAARIDPTLTTVVQATYLGGFANPSNQSTFTEADAVGISAATGEVLVAGATSTKFLPDTAGGAQPAYGGGDEDGFVARLDSGLTRVLQATYIGGSGLDFLYAMAVAPNGDVYVAGQTASTDFPGTAGGAQSVNALGSPAHTPNGLYPSDGFVARLDPTLTTLVQSTYLGGNGSDEARVLAVHPSSGEILVGGNTTSDDLPGRIGGAQQEYLGGEDLSAFDGWVGRLSADLAKGSCTRGDQVLCLNGGRFKVQVSWRVPAQGRSGDGMAVPLTGDTGAFWFREASNLELVIKVLDARSVNGFFWVFYGALSDVEYTITVADTETGLLKTYVNPSGTLASHADTKAFTSDGQAPAGAVVSAERVQERSDAELYAIYQTLTARRVAAPSRAAACAPGSTTLCLNQGRFQVTVDWEVPSQGRSGHGSAVPLEGGDTGYFWFLNDANVELAVKMLDGRPVNGHFWFFYGALSDVQYTIAVTDTQTGSTRSFENPNHTLSSKAYTGTF